VLNIASDHINAVEAKEASFRAAEQEHTEKVRMIGVLQRTIADAERRKVEPIFSSESAAHTFKGMKDNVERLAAEYQNGLWQSVHSARGCKLDLSSDHAIAYFFGDIISAKLPALADQITSRDGRGNGISEAKRAAVVAECDKTIAEGKAKLAELSVQG
jgi:hypothetical protein